MNSKILIFGGTTEAREILNFIPAKYFIYSVATDYGAELVKNFNGLEILTGRLDETQIINLIREKNIKFVIDATHPYAVNISKNIKNACSKTEIELLRVIREKSNLNLIDHKNIICAENSKHAAEILRNTTGNIFITTGINELENFKDFAERAYIRILPDVNSIQKCRDLNFNSGHVIAIQGKFSYEFNKIFMLENNIKYLITKDSGEIGGTNEKLQAAKDLNINVILISRPKFENENENKNNINNVNIKSAVTLIREKLNLKRPPLFPLYIDLENKKILIAGGGNIAARRAETLLKCGAEVYAVSPEFNNNFPENVHKILRKFEFDDLENKFFVIATTNDHDLNKKIAHECKLKNIPVNISDDAGECDFYFPSLINIENIGVSVSSAGLSASTTKFLSDKIRKFLPEWLNEFKNKKNKKAGAPGENRTLGL